MSSQGDDSVCELYVLTSSRLRSVHDIQKVLDNESVTESQFGEADASCCLRLLYGIPEVGPGP